MDYKKLIKERGFPLSLTHFGRIVCLTPHHLRELYNSDRERFDRLLSIAIERWDGICEKVAR